MINSIQQFYSNINTHHSSLTKVGLINLGLVFLFLLFMPFDERMVEGVNTWLKPTKFAASLWIFSWTIAWWLSIYPYSFKWKNRIENFFSIFILIEIAIIATQAARGEMSHYNVATFFDQSMFALMGLGIFSMVLVMLVMAVQSFYKRLDVNKSMLWAIRFGWLAMILAFVGGQIMINQGAHNIGVPDDGPGLPGTNWSTEGGDLRVMHFFGLHAMQIIPILISFPFWKTILKNEKQMTLFSITLGIVYLLGVTFLFWQALNGHPFLEFPKQP